MLEIHKKELEELEGAKEEIEELRRQGSRVCRLKYS
jgi:hypothetical protein